MGSTTNTGASRAMSNPALAKHQLPFPEAAVGTDRASTDCDMRVNCHERVVSFGESPIDSLSFGRDSRGLVEPPDGPPAMPSVGPRGRPPFGGAALRNLSPVPFPELASPCG